MDLIIDANIFMSALISTSGKTFELIFNDKIRLFAPELLMEEIERYRDEILQKSGLSKEELSLFISIISSRIEFIPLEEFSRFENEAAKISPDPDDTEYFALALRLGCPIWTNDRRLKGQTHVKIHSTAEMLEKVK